MTELFVVALQFYAKSGPLASVLVVKLKQVAGHFRNLDIVKLIVGSHSHALRHAQRNMALCRDASRTSSLPSSAASSRPSSMYTTDAEAEREADRAELAHRCFSTDHTLRNDAVFTARLVGLLDEVARVEGLLAVQRAHGQPPLLWRGVTARPPRRQRRVGGAASTTPLLVFFFSSSLLCFLPRLPHCRHLLLLPNTTFSSAHAQLFLHLLDWRWAEGHRRRRRRCSAPSDAQPPFSFSSSSALCVCVRVCVQGTARGVCVCGVECGACRGSVSASPR
ncbi:uncharacterized protein Tco025E_01120 [Trypanosoma conorhini]|uniref:Uncharacterized protein n=1 Tax=Trypanosoma conorhini TaxID=83891 RepID=A0A3R7LG52_9TRYP|nr:uncharacterized protein Tco025E_01120 [Trypanosoma conorhini]RNF26658.1 hypothetical protein Tco025E_01120 [Trypanosoma conorhini]